MNELDSRQEGALNELLRAAGRYAATAVEKHENGAILGQLVIEGDLVLKVTLDLGSGTVSTACVSPSTGEEAVVHVAHFSTTPPLRAESAN
ncbi:MAG: hypothetical protein ACKVVP_03960 [Chloroflexota bacterium]